jgi:glycosyltransferase 2 family protein
MSSAIKNALKATFVFVLLYFLAKNGFLSVENTRRALTQWEYILPAAGLMFLNSFLSVFRWHIFLKAQAITLEFGRILRLSFVGNFFNIALPGAVSGDVVKAVYVAKEIHGMRAKAFSSILFDRVIGLSGLVLVSLGGLVFGMGSQWETGVLVGIEKLVWIMGLTVLFSYVYLFAVHEKIDIVLKVLTHFQARLRVIGSVTRTYEGLMHYRKHRGVVIFGLLLSLAIHVMVILSCIQAGRALGEFSVDEGAYFVLIPLGLLVTAIPIFPAGVGTGHAALGALFQLVGSAKGADIFTLFAVYKILEGAVGGIFYLGFKTKQPLPPVNI